MAAPQTHFVVTWVIWRLILPLVGISISMWSKEFFALFFFGFLIDIDHFFAPAYAKDIFQVRIPRMFKGEDVGAPSPGSKGLTCWLHLWPGFLLSCACSAIFYALHSGWFYLPVLLYVVHYWGIDRWQVSEPHMAPYESFFHPFKGGYIRKKGYPIKARTEILVATALSVLIVFFEFFHLIF